MCVLKYRTGQKKQKVGLSNPSFPTNAITGKSTQDISYMSGGYEKDLIWLAFVAS